MLFDPPLAVQVRDALRAIAAIDGSVHDVLDARGHGDVRDVLSETHFVFGRNAVLGLTGRRLHAEDAVGTVERSGERRTVVHVAGMQLDAERDEL